MEQMRRGLGAYVDRLLFWLVAAATICGAAGCAGGAPAAQPAHPSAQSVYARGATLPPADAAAEIAYYRERSATLATGVSTDIARTDFARMRRGRLYLTGGFGDREIAELQRRLTAAFNAGDEVGVLNVTAQIIERNQVDIRAHMLRAIALRQAGKQSESRTQHDLAMGLIESIMAGGDGLAFASSFTVFDVSEEYEILKVKGCLPGSQALESHEERQFDVLHARKTDGSPCDFYFDITELMALTARHFEPH
jgi:hypothetical protein